MTENEAFAASLKRRRTTLGVSIMRLAVAAGISASYVHAIENGARSPSIDIAERLARELHATVTSMILEQAGAASVSYMTVSEAVEQAMPRSCSCTRFRDTGGVRVGDMACPVHGMGASEQLDGPWATGSYGTSTDQ